MSIVVDRCRSFGARGTARRDLPFYRPTGRSGNEFPAEWRGDANRCPCRIAAIVADLVAAASACSAGRSVAGRHAARPARPAHPACADSLTNFGTRFVSHVSRTVVRYRYTSGSRQSPPRCFVAFVALIALIAIVALAEIRGDDTGDANHNEPQARAGTGRQRHVASVKGGAPGTHHETAHGPSRLSDNRGAGHAAWETSC